MSGEVYPEMELFVTALALDLPSKQDLCHLRFISSRMLIIHAGRYLPKNDFELECQCHHVYTETV